MVRNITQLVRLTALILVMTAATAMAASGLPQFTDLAKKASPAVVNISTVKIVKQQNQLQELFKFHRKDGPLGDFFDQFEQFFGPQGPGGKMPDRKQTSLGSGFIISSDGFIVTNNHVVEKADQITVNLQKNGKGSESYDAAIVGRDPETDLALLKIDVDHSLPTLAFGDSSDMEVGQWVMAIGNPFGLDHTVTAGIISAKGRVIGSGPFDDFIQTDASINPGNSGGPLLNLDGEVIGINSAIIASGQGIGFAIPSTLAKSVIDQLRENKEVKRGWIGVTIQDVDDNMAKALGMDEPKGALISSVMPDQPADKAGVETGDVIVKVNGKDVATSADLLHNIAALAPGDKARLVLWRKGRTVTKSVVLGQRDAARIAQQHGAPGQGEESPQNAATVLGLTVRPVGQEEAQALGLDKPMGLLVSDVENGSPAEENDLRPGDVILQVNQKAVSNPAAFKDIVEKDGKEKGVVMLLIKRQGQNAFRTIPMAK
ncbi:MAG: DegQ family serine endoprotease [Desulfovibrionaceae bacterium]